MNYVFAQALALQNVLKWLFPLVVVITSFGDATKSFLLVFFKKKW
jgi:hypothetical protein